MKTKINSRSSNDLQWQEVKKKVRERDNYECRLCNCLTASEFIQSKKHIHLSFEPTDCAHVEAVGYDPAEIYNIDNIMFLCRAHHSCLDNLIHPITGNHMSDNERWYFWWRAKNRSTKPYDSSIDYHDYYYQEYKKAEEEPQPEEHYDVVFRWW